MSIRLRVKIGQYSSAHNAFARAPFLRRLVPPGLYDESGPSDGVSPAWRAASLALGSLPPNEGSEECAVDPGDMCLVPPATGRVIFLRHGESTWNQADRFTGWEDVPLSPAGEAQVAGAVAILPRVQHACRPTRVRSDVTLQLGVRVRVRLGVG